MINVEKLPGIQVEASAGDVFTRDEVEMAVASIPGWNSLVQPGAKYLPINGSKDWFDRVNRTRWVTHPGQSIGFGQFSSGAPALAMETFVPNKRGFTNEAVRVNLTEWTLFAVMRGPSANTGPAYTVFGSDMEDDPTSADRSVRIGVGGGGMTVYRGVPDNTILTHGEVEPYYGQEFLTMVTYSADTGLTMYYNGDVVASANTGIALNPLTDGSVTLLAHQRYDYPLAGRAGALMGHMGILDIDLSRAVHAKRLELINGWLKGIYDIA